MLRRECLGSAQGSTRETPAAAPRDSVRWNLLCAVERMLYNPFVLPKAFSAENGLGESTQWDAGAVTQGEA